MHLVTNKKTITDWLGISLGSQFIQTRKSLEKFEPRKKRNSRKMYNHLPAIAGECASNENPPSEKLRKSFSRSRCKSSCINRSSLPPPDVEPGLCWSDKLLGTGECVPNEISESESSDGVGDALSACRERSDEPDPDIGWFILQKSKENMEFRKKMNIGTHWNAEKWKKNCLLMLKWYRKVATTYSIWWWK